MPRIPSVLLAPLALGLILLVAAPGWSNPTLETPTFGAPDPNFIAGKKAVDKEDWKTAIELLTKAAQRDDFNADIHNLLGFSYRHQGNLDQAFAHYYRALSLNPNHRGAHEYIGVAFLMQNELAKAEEHLAALKGICGDCEEYDDLKKAIASYRMRSANQPAQR